jgi:cob(I)alamin adenosyltransferase
VPRDRNEPVRLTRIYTRGGDAGETSLGDGSRADERLRTTQAMVNGLEALCDEHNATLPELKSFVLPGGTEAAARLHVARTVARRAEIAALEADVNPLARVYLNRVSDLLFILARSANALAGRDEPLWRPGERPSERAT